MLWFSNTRKAKAVFADKTRDMARKKTLSPINSLVAAEPVRALIAAVQHETSNRTLSAKSYEKCIRELERMRGRPLMMPMLTSGAGKAARVWMADGTMKLDFIGGIGVYAFGHNDPDLLETAVVAAASDSVFQGHLMPGPEELRISRALLRDAGEHMKHVWLALSGAVANENALKMIFQKHAPADKIVVFEGGFHGRTMAMAELTDRPINLACSGGKTGALSRAFEGEWRRTNFGWRDRSAVPLGGPRTHALCHHDPATPLSARRNFWTRSRALPHH